MSLLRDPGARRLFSRIPAGLVLALALFLLPGAGPAAAQYDAQNLPPQGVPGAQDAARSQQCMRLEAQLAQLGPTGGAGNMEAAVAKQRQQLDFLNGQANQYDCNRQGFLIFQPQLPPQCTDIKNRQAQAQARLDQMMNQLDAQRSGADAQRRQLVQQLAQNDCGPQYRAALGAGQGQPQQRQPRQPRNFFEQLFGVPADEAAQPSEEAPPPDIQPAEMPKVSTYRTVCVRTCDGFFFPISFSTTPANFAADEALCQRQCPGTEARLFAYRNPGEDIMQAVGTNGQPYSALPNAGLYKKQFVSACTCKPAGMSWGQALSGADGADTLRQGDILVTEDKARQLSQPVPATPATAKPGAKPAAAKPLPQLND
ncbi:DUF2865 domain-containing protein [Ancylobacter sp. 6x-1]|uniref:DUF2865 domain-containing protein n=1 Tax=Ancylobacter crimeensis TaxID=2579147 RepID=A0ABT0D888_9HYPH|nr:DUF2865 domain-containing protein [Ancylobacter crimeensis]MCK0196161.1 DUF2865 domain-containing protein [Ancylobacter crimeensis]